MVTAGKRDKRTLRTLLEDALGGHRLSDEEALRLFLTDDRSVWQIAAAADEAGERTGTCRHVCPESEYQCDELLYQLLWILRLFQKGGG